MTKINMNRAVPLAEPSAELQRLTTYNALLKDTLRDLYKYHTAFDDARNDFLDKEMRKRVEKVLA